MQNAVPGFKRSTGVLMHFPGKMMLPARNAKNAELFFRKDLLLIEFFIRIHPVYPNGPE